MKGMRLGSPTFLRYCEVMIKAAIMGRPNWGQLATPLKPALYRDRPTIAMLTATAQHPRHMSVAWLAGTTMKFSTTHKLFHNASMQGNTAM